MAGVWTAAGWLVSRHQAHLRCGLQQVIVGGCAKTGWCPTFSLRWPSYWPMLLSAVSFAWTLSTFQAHHDICCLSDVAGAAGRADEVIATDSEDIKQRVNEITGRSQHLCFTR